MKRNKGFTLIELLVVMAIIAILASIVVPNVQRYIIRARLTKAIAELSGMDMALTAIVTDAGRGNLGQLLHKDAAQATCLSDPSLSISWISAPDTIRNDVMSYQLFENATNIYSRIAYDLLRLGRDCLRADSLSILNKDSFQFTNLLGDPMDWILGDNRIAYGQVLGDIPEMALQQVHVGLFHSVLLV
jgi:prepilin-type N-terminal cleavage/methylation domain-containing protein